MTEALDRKTIELAVRAAERALEKGEPDVRAGRFNPALFEIKPAEAATQSRSVARRPRKSAR